MIIVNTEMEIIHHVTKTTETEIAIDQDMWIIGIEINTKINMIETMIPAGGKIITVIYNFDEISLN